MREALTKPATRHADFGSEISATFTEPVDCNTVSVAVYSNGDLIAADTAYTLLCAGSVVGIDFNTVQVCSVVLFLFRFSIVLLDSFQPLREQK